MYINLPEKTKTLLNSPSLGDIKIGLAVAKTQLSEKEFKLLLIDTFFSKTIINKRDENKSFDWENWEEYKDPWD
jgi:hypothetical protein